MALVDALLRASLRHFRDPIHKLVDEGYDRAQASALSAIDGQPDADGELNPFEKQLTEAERQSLATFITVFRSRVHTEVDRLLDAAV